MVLYVSKDITYQTPWQPTVGTYRETIVTDFACCGYVCGVCHQLQTIYEYQDVERTPYLPIQHIMTQRCAVNDQACVNVWLLQHAVNQTFECWYHRDDRFSGVSMSFIHHDVDGWSIFSAVFTFVLACIYGLQYFGAW